MIELSEDEAKKCLDAIERYCRILTSSGSKYFDPDASIYYMEVEDKLRDALGETWWGLE